MGILKHLLQWDNTPPCIVCKHCIEKVEEGYYGDAYTERRCAIVTSLDGTDFEKCAKARRTEFCRFKEKE